MNIHSWAIKDWPIEYYPNSPEKARYLVRTNRVELAAAGALVRVGRELVIIREPYLQWMQEKRTGVHGYDCPANRPKK